jgi:hypothetical protein
MLLLAASQGRGQTCSLAEVVKAGDCFHCTIDMQLEGEMRFRQDGKTVPVKLAATAHHAYPERVLAAGGSLVLKSARLYEAAGASIRRGPSKTDSTLRKGRTFIVAQRHKDQYLVYSPAGALYRGELELLADHFDTLDVAGVLPGKAVGVGESWKLANAVTQALCSLEGMTENKLEGRLEKASAAEATFRISGTAAGVEAGALVKMTVEAVGSFDRKAMRLTRLEWKQTDDRQQGPVSPASSVRTKVVLARKPVAVPRTLDDTALVAVPAGYAPPAAMTYVELRDEKGRFALLHTRDWQLTAVTADRAVLRLVDRGDFVAQVSVTPWEKAKKGEHLSAAAFKEAMAATSGWEPAQELQSGEVPSGEGRWVYRLSVQGKLQGVEVLQNFYLVAAPTGEQVVLTFTLSPRHADKLGARDLALAGSMEVPAAAEKK